jgi:hypothetical protein
VDSGACQVAQGGHDGGGVVAADVAGVLGEQWPRAQAAISAASAWWAAKSVTA